MNFNFGPTGAFIPRSSSPQLPSISDVEESPLQASFSLENTSYSLSRRVRHFETLNARQARKQVIYMEFQNAAEQEEDKFWGNLLLLASRGEFRDKKIKYNGKYLIKSDTRATQLMPRGLAELSKAFKKFMHELGSISSDEMNKQQATMERIMNRQITLRWEICTDERKAGLLFEYAARQAEEFEMTLDQRLSLERCIEVGLVEGSITQSTVRFDRNAVQNVSTITRHESGFWYLQTNNMQIRRKNKPKIKTKTAEDMWYKVAASYG